MAQSEKNSASASGATTVAPISVKAFRSLRGDIADLVNESKISRKALAKIDKRLEKQVEEYAAAGGDEKVSAAIIAKESNTASDEDAMTTPEALPFVIRKIREAHGDTDDSNLSREAIVNEIEKDYSDGGSGTEVIDLGGEQGRQPRNQTQEPRVISRTVQGVMASDKSGKGNRTLEGEPVYKDEPLPDMSPKRVVGASPVDVQVNINHEDLEEKAAPKYIPVYIEREPAAPVDAAPPAPPQPIRPAPMRANSPFAARPVKPARPVRPVQAVEIPQPAPAIPENVKPEEPAPAKVEPKVEEVQPKPAPKPKIEVKHEIKFTPTPPTAGFEKKPDTPVPPPAPAASEQPKVESKPESKTNVEVESVPEIKKVPTPPPAPMPPKEPQSSFIPTPPLSSFPSKKEKEKAVEQKNDEETFDEKIADIEVSIEELTTRASGMQQEAADLKNQRDTLQSSLDPIIAKEKDIEFQEAALDAELDKTIDPDAKREIESKRWGLEEEREKIEKDRWSVEQDIVAIDEKQRELSRRQDKNSREKKSLTEKLEDLKIKKAGLSAKAEKTDVARQLAEVKEMEKNLEAEWKTLHSEYEKAEHSLDALLKQEEDVRSDIKRVSARQSQTSRPEERHRLEEERSKKEASRKQMEESEWSVEEQATKAEKLITDLQDKFQKIKSNELALSTKVKELDAIITKAGV